MGDPEDLSDIIRAIRDVDASLERRLERAQGATMVMWGVVTFVISLFYQLVAWNPEPYRAAFGALLPWVWAAPVAAGYAASALTGARIASSAGASAKARAAMADFLPVAVSAALAAGLVLAQHTERIAGALLVGFALTLWLRCVRAPRGPFRSGALGVAAICTVAGAALAVWPLPWSWLASGVLYGGALAFLGRWRMTLAG